MISPAPGSILTSDTATFQWTPVPGAVNYDLIAQFRDGTTAEVDGFTGATGTLPGIKADGQQFDLTVRWNQPAGVYKGGNTFVYTAWPGGGLPPIATYPVTVSPGAWASIYGTNLSQTTRSWKAADFVNGNLPTSLDGVSVLVNGQNAYVSYVSPTQVNFLVPASCCKAGIIVTFVNSFGNVALLAYSAGAFAPGLFSLPQLGGIYAVATFPDGSLVGPPGLLGSAATTKPASVGDAVTLWASGLGATNPAHPDGQLITQPLGLANTLSVQIGGVDAQVDFAALVEAGLYQINVRVPSVVSGDEPIALNIAGYTNSTPQYIWVQ